MRKTSSQPVQYVEKGISDFSLKLLKSLYHRAKPGFSENKSLKK